MTINNKEFKHHPSGLFVSRDGEIFVPKSRKFPNGHFTYGSTNNRDYKVVQYKGKHYLVHRLVAECFIPNPNNYVEVDHVNRYKENNNVDNLRWATRGLQMKNRDFSKFKNNAQSKPVLQLTKDGELVMEWPSAAECGRNGYNQGHVSACCRGEIKHYKKYIWRYKEEELEEI